MNLYFLDLKEKVVDLDEIKMGDLILVRPGEKIPVDGIIIDGETSIDESMITGESMPVDKKRGDWIIGGTINKQGRIIFKAKKIGKETLLSQIIELVKQAQITKPPIQKLADLIASFFVPVVIFLSIITFIFWFFKIGITPGLLNAISVLIIACPCVLGLATPIAITIGLNKGAREGILIKDSSIFEILPKTKVIIFDKTGTITEGKIKTEKIIVNSKAKSKVDKSYIINLAGSLEKFSEHPIGKSIYQYAKNKRIDFLPVSNFKSKTGFGVEGKINNKNIYLGRLIDKSDDFNEAFEEKEKGKTVVYVYQENNLLGGIVVKDVVKKEAIETISQLKKLNFKIFLLTGDNKKTALSIGKDIGVDQENIFYELLPEDKKNIIVKLKKKINQKIIFVGDGINDSPALLTADVGIAMGRGTDIAIESGQIVLMNNDLKNIIKLINLSKKTLLIIKQNLFWAFFYNVILIPVAMAGMINPILASGAMTISSLSVVLNSLRLKL